MASELIYTSAERGLRPGTRGYCTVAHTRGLAPAALQVMEALSAYKSLYGVHEEVFADNPISFSHYCSTLLGRSVSVLSRVSPVQADHTGRSNKLAHHVLLHAREYPAGGPLWLSRQPGFFLESWDGEPRLLEMPKAVPTGEEVCGKAETWEKITGDAGHAAWLPALFQKAPGQIVYLIFSPGMPMLSLLSEAMALLPAAKRWQVTYNTYFTTLPAGMSCLWRCCVPEAEILRDVRRNPQSKILDLTEQLPPLAENAFVQLARHGLSAEEGAAVPAEAGNDPAPVRKRFELMPRRRMNMLNAKPRTKEDGRP
jgi:hypothetical protein